MEWLPVSYPSQGTRCVLRARHGEPSPALVVHMNPRPSLWREYVAGPLRSTFWISVGALIVITLAMVGLELGEYAPALVYYWVDQ